MLNSCISNKRLYNNCMEEFLPYMTNDYSVGLYSKSTDDIYHSAFGALSEAYEKFILPANLKNIFNKTNNIKILDICYGIGYNTKAFLNEFINLDTKDYKIEIDCVDNDELLIKLSPFICTYINKFKRLFYKNKLYKNIENYSEAKNIITKYIKTKCKYKIQPSVNLILIRSLIENYGSDFLNDSIKNLFDNDKKIFFDDFYLKFYKFWIKNKVLLDQNKNKTAYLHNIYYENISKQYKTFKKCISNNIVNVKFYSKDVRQFILNTTNKYDIIFMDGFTPSKCPCIWSEDFFKELFKHQKDDAILLTYNSSAVTRNAMLQAGFYIGNSFNENNKIIGTVASKNSNIIKYKLSDKELGILNTKAGIPYRDADLNLDNYIIKQNRKNEVEISNLESSSKYLKRYKNEI